VLTGEYAGAGDDDIWGFVLGFNPGDATATYDSVNGVWVATNPNAEYLLIDWKRLNQNYDNPDRAGAPAFNALTPGGIASAGLSVSRVNGVPNADELWQKIDYAQTTTGSVTYLAPANTLGGTGYGINEEFHDFEILYEANRAQVSINGTLEFDIAGNFANGRFGLYNHSQDAVTSYSNFSIEAISPVVNTPGDFDSDGDVDGADFIAWQTNFPTVGGATLADGDADSDGDVDGTDFVLWQTHFPSGPAAGTSPVPEPGSWLLTIAGITALLAARFRRRQ
jgi:hypothetical protein